MAKTRRIGWVALAIYGVSIVLANWLIRNIGPIVIPGGNHLVPVGFGLAAPTGTYAAGLTFVCRDVVQRTIGKRWSLLIIIPGTFLSAFLDVHLAHCGSSPAPAKCAALPDQPDALRSGIYLATDGGRPAVTRGNIIRNNTVRGFGIAKHCIAAAKGVDLRANTIAGNTCQSAP